MERNPRITLPHSVYPLLSDTQLVQLTQAGFTPAYDTLAARYRSAICHVAARYVGAEAAKDVAQDVFLLALHALPNLDDPAKFGGWLRTIARHRAERMAKREQRQEPTDHTAFEGIGHPLFAAIQMGPEETCLQQERLRQVWQAMEYLPENYREVLLLHYIEDWPVSRLAGFLSVSEDVVRGRLYRARTALRQYLTDERKTKGRRNEYQ